MVLEHHIENNLGFVVAGGVCLFAIMFMGDKKIRS